MSSTVKMNGLGCDEKERVMVQHYCIQDIIGLGEWYGLFGAQKKLKRGVLVSDVVALHCIHGCCGF